MCFFSNSTNAAPSFNSQMTSKAAARDLDAKQIQAVKAGIVTQVQLNQLSSSARQAAQRGDHATAITQLKELDAKLGGSKELQQQIRFSQAMKIGIERNEDVRFQFDDGSFVTMRKQ